MSLQLAISEALVWSAAELLRRLQAATEAGGAEAGGAAGGAASAVGGAQVAAADMPVRIRLLAVDDLRTQISFQGDPFSRPRDLAGGLLSSVIDLANFQAAPIALQVRQCSCSSSSRNVSIFPLLIDGLLCRAPVLPAAPCCCTCRV